MVKFGSKVMAEGEVGGHTNKKNDNKFTVNKNQEFQVYHCNEVKQDWLKGR